MRHVPLALLLLAFSAAPALGYDPEARRSAERTPPSAAAPDLESVAGRWGLHRVTEPYVADRVTRTGDLTVYSTDTERKVTSTFAKELQTVSTGERSRLDGSSFNGRTALTTGEPVAGTYYENYVWASERFVAVSIVFFQDDSELARRLSRERPAPPESLDPALPPGAVSPPPDRTGDRERDSDRDRDQDAAPPTLVIGVDPTGGAALRQSLEVARGRRYALTVNVRAREPLVLEAWQLVAGIDDAANPAGWRPAAERLAGLWLRLPAPDTAWPLTLRVRVRRASSGASFVAAGVVRIFVRAPAIVE